jgi:hypothetical protein
MSNNIIQIDKGKYTALLRRVLGMQPSENGVSELQTLGRIARRTGLRLENESINAQQAELEMENLEFVTEYFRLRKDEMLYAKHEQSEITVEVNEEPYFDTRPNGYVEDTTFG